MELLPNSPTSVGPAANFIGAVYVNEVYRGTGVSRMRANLVRFTPSAHTAWHCHTMGQTLHCTDGLGLVAGRDGTVIMLRPGDTVHTPPGEWHWHGAGVDCFMSHLALTEVPEDGTPAVTWGDHVTEEEYRAANEIVRPTTTD